MEKQMFLVYGKTETRFIYDPYDQAVGYDTRKMFLCAYCYSYRMMRAVQAYLGQHGGPNMGPRPTVSLQKLQKITQPTRED